MRRALLAIVVAACTEGAPPDFGDDPTDPDLPPRGTADLDAWLAAGHYLGWNCEPAPVDVRLGSPHRPQTRTCNNAAITASVDPVLPPGAASVKEMYDDAGAIKGYGVSRKITSGGGMGWYWYERIGSRVLADGMGAGSCPACHANAARDFTFVILP